MPSIHNRDRDVQIRFDRDTADKLRAMEVYDGESLSSIAKRIVKQSVMKVQNNTTTINVGSPVITDNTITNIHLEEKLSKVEVLEDRLEKLTRLVESLTEKVFAP